ncbi:hypothetical protein HU200_044804 [Digitaria exilis]|uniref:Uncharacterized protein n=1 Tax=Digitaria exilis TaxID=1010633 RepID=A0A835B1N2_9POAL|nr:hypothetical protein HU200_044804 [Digitaria exilis]
MEGELGFISPARPSRVTSERGDGRGIGSPTWGSPLEKLFNSPPSCASDDSRAGGNRSGFCSPTWGSSTLFSSPSSCASDSGGGGNVSGSGFSTTKQASPVETLFSSPSSSCVSDSRGGGSGSGYSMPKQASPLETTLLNSPSSCVSDSRDCGNSSSPRISKEQDSAVQKAEGLLRAITERYNDCFLRLHNATAELADLRRERIRLGAENLHLSVLLEELVIAEQSKQASAVALTPPLKPVQAEAAFGCAPKSISIRSKGYLSPKQPQHETQPQRLRVRASPAMEVRSQIPPAISQRLEPCLCSILISLARLNFHIREHCFLKFGNNRNSGSNLPYSTIQ